MEESYAMRVIARVHSAFPEKFGIPRQSGLVPELRAELIFEPDFRDPAMLRGLEGFSHLWLIWGFSASTVRSAAVRPATVRPPRLGGNRRVGVFATRSPFRPNPIALSCVRLDEIRRDARRGPVLSIAGADLMDGSPVFDIKPYLPYTDAHPEAHGGFAENAPAPLDVRIPDALLERIPPEQRAALRGVLAQDPRPSYQDDPARVYGLSFAGRNIRFRVSDGVLTVVEVEERQRP